MVNYNEESYLIHFLETKSKVRHDDGPIEPNFEQRHLVFDMFDSNHVE